jgi:hypothetical protein
VRALAKAQSNHRLQNAHGDWLLVACLNEKIAQNRLWHLVDEV